MQNSKRIYYLVSPLSERFPWCAGDAHWLVVVQSISHVHLFVTPWTAECQASLSFIISRSLLRLMSIESVMPSNHLIVCHSLLLPSVFPSIRVFSSESALHNRWPEYWSFSFSISPSSEYSALISFRIDWFDLCSPMNSQKSSPMPQFESINCLVLSLLYGLTLTSVRDCWKTIALTLWTLSAKLCLCFFTGYFYSIFTSTFESLNERSKIQWFSRWIFWNAFFLFFLTSALRDLLEISPVCFILEIQMDVM